MDKETPSTANWLSPVMIPDNLSAKRFSGISQYYDADDNFSLGSPTTITSKTPFPDQENNNQNQLGINLETRLSYDSFSDIPLDGSASDIFEIQDAAPNKKTEYTLINDVPVIIIHMADDGKDHETANQLTLPEKTLQLSHELLKSMIPKKFHQLPRKNSQASFQDPETKLATVKRLSQIIPVIPSPFYRQVRIWLYYFLFLASTLSWSFLYSNYDKYAMLRFSEDATRESVNFFLGIAAFSAIVSLLYIATYIILKPNINNNPHCFTLFPNKWTTRVEFVIHSLLIVVWMWGLFNFGMQSSSCYGEEDLLIKFGVHGLCQINTLSIVMGVFATIIALAIFRYRYIEMKHMGLIKHLIM